MAHKVTLVPGDGIGPEVTQQVVRILEATGVKFEWERYAAGAEAFEIYGEYIPTALYESIERNKVALKGPLETPVGFGEKSANVTLRKLFETYGNIRPVHELPGIRTPYSGRGIDFVVVRENIEDLYAGIEHMQTPDVAQALKIITRKGSEKIIRLAEHTGAGTVQINFNRGAMPQEMFVEQLRRFARDVLPILQAHQITSVPAAETVPA